MFFSKKIKKNKNLRQGNVITRLHEILEVSCFSFKLWSSLAIVGDHDDGEAKCSYHDDTSLNCSTEDGWVRSGLLYKLALATVWGTGEFYILREYTQVNHSIVDPADNSG